MNRKDDTGDAPTDFCRHCGVEIPREHECCEACARAWYEDPANAYGDVDSWDDGFDPYPV